MIYGIPGSSTCFPGLLFNKKRPALEGRSCTELSPMSGQNLQIYMCWGLNSHWFPVVGDGHQPNRRGVYTHYKDSLLKVGSLI